MLVAGPPTQARLGTAQALLLAVQGPLPVAQLLVVVLLLARLPLVALALLLLLLLPAWRCPL